MFVKYTYQIKSVLQNAERGIVGFQVIVATTDSFYSVNAPAEIFDNETLAYIRFRLRVCASMDIRQLPRPVQNKIRTPLGRFLDFWILESKDGYHRERKNPNA